MSHLESENLRWDWAGESVDFDYLASRLEQAYGLAPPTPMRDPPFYEASGDPWSSIADAARQSEPRHRLHPRPAAASIRQHGGGYEIEPDRPSPC